MKTVNTVDTVGTNRDAVIAERIAQLEQVVGAAIPDVQAWCLEALRNEQTLRSHLLHTANDATNTAAEIRLLLREGP